MSENNHQRFAGSMSNREGGCQPMNAISLGMTPGRSGLATFGGCARFGSAKSDHDCKCDGDCPCKVEKRFGTYAARKSQRKSDGVRRVGHISDGIGMLTPIDDVNALLSFYHAGHVHGFHVEYTRSEGNPAPGLVTGIDATDEWFDFLVGKEFPFEIQSRRYGARMPRAMRAVRPVFRARRPAAPTARPIVGLGRGTRPKPMEVNTGGQSWKGGWLTNSDAEGCRDHCHTVELVKGTPYEECKVDCFDGASKPKPWVPTGD